ncbi:MAG: T9SS type A sorting domain-containing protein [Cytophagales bacterium]|nr:T9SS type A sorting domain-containing protein [Cytophagales bacterium]
MMYPFLLRRGYALLFSLLLWLAATSTQAAGLVPDPFFLGTATPSPTSFTLNATEKFASTSRALSITVQGVSSVDATTIQVPDFCEIADPATLTFGAARTVKGNGTFQSLLRLKSTLAPGGFNGTIVISGPGLSTALVSVQGFVTANPGFFPKSLFFSTQVGKASLPQNLTVTIQNLSAGVQTTVAAPSQFQVAAPGSAAFGSSVTLTGSGTFQVPVQFTGSATVGNVTGNLTVSGGGINTKTVPMTAAALAVPTPVVNPTSLSGFTAVEGGASSAAKSFDLSVTGLPTQGSISVGVTAPAGYAVSFSGSSGFVNSLVVFASGGKISAKVFVILSGNRPAGTVNGNLTITGNAIISKNLPLSGTVAPKPLPTLNVDKTFLSFSTPAFKASAAQTYQLTGSNLPSGAIAKVTAPAGYEVRLGTSGTIFSSSVSAATSNGTLNATVSVRLKSSTTVGAVDGTLLNTVAGLTKGIGLSGKVLPPPLLTLTPTALNAFSTVKNQASAAQTYFVAATDLPTGATATVTAPAGFELRIQNTGSFVGTLTLSQVSAGTIARTLEVRLKSQSVTANSTFTGNITHSVAGLSKSIGVTGTVRVPTLSLSTTSLVGFSALVNQPSAPKTYTLTAANLASGASGTVTAPAGYEVRVQNTGSFVTSLTLAQTVPGSISRTLEVRMKARSTTGTVSGTLTHAVAGLTKTISLSGSVKAALTTIAATSSPGAAATVAPASLAGLITTEGRLARATDAKPFLLTVQGGPRSGLVYVNAPAGFLVSLSRNPAAFVKSLALPLVYQWSDSIFVRLDGNQAGQYAGTVDITGNFFAQTGVAVSGTTLPKPTLAVNPASALFTAFPGQPSAAQSYTVSAANLEPGVFVRVNVPDGFESSLIPDGPFSATGYLTLHQNVPYGVERTVYVRLAPQPQPTYVSGSITHIVLPGVFLQKSVAVSGYVVLPKPPPSAHVSVTSLSGFAAGANSPSAAQSYAFSGHDLPPGASVYVKAPTGYEIKAFSAAPFDSIILAKATSSGSFYLTIAVRLKAQANPGTVAGTIQNKTAGFSKPVEVSGTVSAAPYAAARSGNPEGAAEPQSRVTVDAYPNPVRDVLSVLLAAPAGGPLQLSLTDLQGRSLLEREVRLQGKTERVELPFGDQQPGPYLLHVRSAAGHQVLKVVKQ